MYAAAQAERPQQSQNKIAQLSTDGSREHTARQEHEECTGKKFQHTTWDGSVHFV